MVFGCDQAPTVPTPDVTGVWIGRYEETHCSGSCLPCCSARFKTGAPVRDFRLTLTQQGSSIAGQFEELRLENSGALTGPVVGGVSAFQLNLTGKLSWFSELDPTVFQLTDLRDFNGRVDPKGEHITGRFALRDIATDGSTFMHRECKIVWLAPASQ
jgi:hypothetical protein